MIYAVVLSATQPILKLWTAGADLHISGVFAYLVLPPQGPKIRFMHPYYAKLEGRTFFAEKPVIVLGWPAPGSVAGFDSRMAAWSYVEVAARQDCHAIFARVFEHAGEQWLRIPSRPTYLQILEESHTAKQNRWPRPVAVEVCSISVQ